MRRREPLRRGPLPASPLSPRAAPLRGDRLPGQVLRGPARCPPGLARRLPAGHRPPSIAGRPSDRPPQGGIALMLSQLLKKKKELHLERSYDAPVDTVWEAWTDADVLARWWGPEKTFVPAAEVDL